MAKTAVNEANPGLITRIQTFFQEVKMEMGKVTWPTRDDLRLSTQTTLYLLGIMALIIFVYDWVFSQAAYWILSFFS